MPNATFIAATQGKADAFRSLNKWIEPNEILAAHTIPTNLLNRQGLTLLERKALEEAEDSSITQEAQPAKESGRLQVLGFYDALNTILARATQDEDNEDNCHPNRIQEVSPSRSNASTRPPSYDSSNPSSVPPASRDSVSNVDGTFDIFFIRPLSTGGPMLIPPSPSMTPSSIFPSTPPNSNSSFYNNKAMPSLMPSNKYVSPPAEPPPIKPKLAHAKASIYEEDVPMLSLSAESFEPTTGDIPYHGHLRADGRTTILFDRLTNAHAEQYLTSTYAQYNDYHSVYIPNVIHTIESFCSCQVNIISNDWNVHMFRDGTYAGHPVISGGIKLPMGGPRLGRTWQERIPELRDHRAHMRHIINVLDTVLSTRMLAEATTHAKTIKCDNLLHIQGGLTEKRLNAYAAAAEAHGEPELASKILDALLMPFPNKDIVSTLTESQFLNIGTSQDILRLTHERDLVLGITCTGLAIVATSPFRSKKFDDLGFSNEWYILSDINEEDEEDQHSKSKKFFL
ncbi:hypothetical protein DFJ58DRAFT_745538 [Suillus subalutaceus]|uniref:uncharacterized protein n=1 Tax=Suillus subalutaceus TaxID=48586 RepID=UPI001B88287E|nr:uncharacterized protein DFJ58DRAFT_745538 [Suillus subalutaceus]KAG1855177.1 hypothetical protein DFJ58DRAFT_745538 [Suillus subalutaceus]